MAVKIYSDVTKKFYDDEATALKAEEELKQAKDAEAACRKKMAQAVEEKRKAYEQARKEYHKALNDFCDKYGSYHYTLTDKDIDNIFFGTRFFPFL